MKDAFSGNVASHYFGTPDEIKDVSAKQMLKLMYNTEFSETRLEAAGIGSANFEELSYEDKKFLEMMDENTEKVGKHYQLPLPLKNHKTFPNNRYLAEKKLQYLKGRFIKNPKYFVDYKGFMDDLIRKGYAEKSTKEAPEGRTRYIPHHGVYHRSKPGKIRVVFDCSAEFKEVSLNKNLMSGPDLTNQIVGVLTRFHEDPDASQNVYGQVTYLGIVDEKGYIKCSLVMAKSRVPPTKFVSIPRLELTAASLSIKISTMLRGELTIHATIKEYFWTDCEVVLGYVNNGAKHFKIFVANRVQLIWENSDVNQWVYVDSRSNLADDTSHGISPSNQEKVNRWLNGPEFLWLDESKWTTYGKKDILEVDQDDPEVKTNLSVHVTSAVNEGMGNSSAEQGFIMD